MNSTTLTWQNVKVEFTDSKRRNVCVLQGKSTLMDVLAARALHGGTVHPQSRVLVNGSRMAPSEFVRMRAFVPQEDRLVACLTARETVTLHAELDLPPRTSAASRAACVDQVLHEMGLSKQQHTLVGGNLGGGVSLRGLSGGQKRRLNIASRIVAAPPVVFLIILYLKVYAARSHTVITTLHQPSSAIWIEIDKAWCRTYFNGELGLRYIPERNGLPSDWVMDLMSPGMALVIQQGQDDGDCKTADSVRERLEAAAARFQSRWGGSAPDQDKKVGNVATANGASAPNFDVAVINGDTANTANGGSFAKVAIGSNEGNDGGIVPKEDCNEASSRSDGGAVAAAGCCGGGGGAAAAAACGGAPVDAAAADVSSQVAAAGRSTWLHQFVVLLKREVQMITRNRADAAGRMVTCMLTGLLQGLVFLNLNNEGTAWQSRLGCIFLNLIIVTELPFISMGLILSDAWLLIREAAEGMYSATACYAARLVVNTVLNSLNAAVYALTAYGLAGLRPGGEHILVFVVILVLSHLIMCQIMAFGAVVLPNQDTAFMFAVALAVWHILLANFPFRWKDISWSWVAALRFGSPMYFSFGSLVGNEFGGRTLPCPLRSGPICISDGDDVVALYKDYSLGTTLVVLAAWWVGLHALTLGAMAAWRIRQLRG
ncbi:hypothetical protein PLESTB_000642400 [Pleodorina starrii]|uniref:ABC-2 type transporter domain-containing protein n=1 Tax=Pleodorina starrii TaxID=330485 RepID=A0A9W6BI78_9CHLO|nr:hypothetical protein PLESTM_001303700 [Pleodorina starrii]GLC52554.1 hypothetical protein PLESTB_000642400 [Pleodorina starrii]GLC71554.1 hypothetical protein PLESTF_001134600 [Pleodorina starrii]